MANKRINDLPLESTPAATDRMAIDGATTRGAALGSAVSGLMSGTALSPASGGTGLASYTIGDLIQASGAATLANLAAVATGNVLLSGGVGTVSAWGKVGLTTHVSGTLPGANGGTGNASYAVGDILYASGATTLTKLAGVATGNALISGGVTTAPSWGKIGLSTHVSGTLPVGNGGTGNTTFTAYSVLCAGTTAAGAFQNVSGLGTSGQVLTSAGAGALPAWQTPAAGSAAATQAEMEAANSTSVVVTPGRQHFHPGHAKVASNFNGTGTPAFGQTYQTSSITDSGTGDFTVNFVPTFSANTYAISAGAAASQQSTIPNTVNSVDFDTFSAGTNTRTDSGTNSLAIFGDLT